MKRCVVGIEVGFANSNILFKIFLFSPFFLLGLMPIHAVAHIGDLPLVRCPVEEFGARPGSNGAQTHNVHLDRRAAIIIAVMHGHVPIVGYLVNRYATQAFG